jgi:hypothetical protein
MHALAFNLTWIYLTALVLSTGLTCSLLVRSNRTAVFHVLSLFNFFVLAGLFIRLLEWHAPNSALTDLFISAGLVALCSMLALLVQVIYTVLTGLRFSLLVQMISGAGTLVLIFMAMTFLPRIRSAYRILSSDIWFRIYLLLPLIVFLVSGPFIAWLISRRHLNMTTLSFDRVMPVLPDAIFVFDQDGILVDHNSRDPVLSACADRDQIIDALRSHCGGDYRNLVRALLNPGQRVSGEIEWRDEQEQVAIWAWRLQAIRGQRNRLIGSILLLTDMTSARTTAHLLEAQNDELRRINRRLSEYSDLPERYAGAATEQEVAAIIDTSIRQRLEQARTLLTDAENEAAQASQKQIAVTVIRECRQALADIRALVGHLTS